MKIKILFVSFIFALNLSVYSKTIHIYHTSDVHGGYFSRQAKWDSENSTRIIGGFAVFSNLLKQDKNPYILLDSGDLFQGTPEGNFTKGMASIEFMNYLGYSASTVGNHDYDYGESALKDLAKNAKFDFLGANIYYKKDGKNPEYVKPYKIIEIGGEKIAVLGIAGEHTRTSTLPTNVKHLDFKDEAGETAKYIKEINALKPDAIIILAHIGISGEFAQAIVDISTYDFTNQNLRHSTIELARAAKNANLIFGGHVHTGLLNGWKDPQTNTTLCESYFSLTHVSMATLEFDDKTNKLQSVSCKLIPLWKDIYGEDEKVIAISTQIISKTDEIMAKVIGEAVEDIGYSKNSPDSPIGNWMTDIMRDYAKADGAFQNSGGIRGQIFKGPVKLRDVYQVMPFENTLVKLTMTGEQIEKLIKDNLREERTSMQISGFNVKYKVKNNRVSEVIVEKDGKQINKNDKFKIVTNNYLTTGGSGGKALMLSSDINDTMISIRDIIIKYIETNKQIKSPGTGRFIKID